MNPSSATKRPSSFSASLSNSSCACPLATTLRSTRPSSPKWSATSLICARGVSPNSARPSTRTVPSPPRRTRRSMRAVGPSSATIISPSRTSTPASRWRAPSPLPVNRPVYSGAPKCPPMRACIATGQPAANPPEPIRPRSTGCRPAHRAGHRAEHPPPAMPRARRCARFVRPASVPRLRPCSCWLKRHTPSRALSARRASVSPSRCVTPRTVVRGADAGVDARARSTLRLSAARRSAHARIGDMQIAAVRSSTASATTPRRAAAQIDASGDRQSAAPAELGCSRASSGATASGSSSACTSTCVACPGGAI